MEKGLIKVGIILGICLLATECLAVEEITSLVKQVMPGVILIKTYDSNGNNLSQGSGFVISKEGDVVTCYHVMRGYSKATVTTSDEKIFQVIDVTALNKSDDLVKISVSADNYSFANLTMNTTLPDVGQEIIAIGGPLGLEKTVSQGIVSAIRNNTIQITAPTSPGSSGGPVFNMRGEVIGIVSSQMKYGQNLNFAIPAYLIATMQQPSAEQVKELLEPLSEVMNTDAPLWKILGYTSEEEFLHPAPWEPKSPSDRYNLRCWNLFSLTEKFDAAISCFNCILEMNPSYAPAWNNKGAELYYLTRYEEALLCFNKSIELDSSDKTFWQNKGAALKKLHREVEANAAFTKASEFPKGTLFKLNSMTIALKDGIDAMNQREIGKVSG